MLVYSLVPDGVESALIEQGGHRDMRDSLQTSVKEASTILLT